MPSRLCRPRDPQSTSPGCRARHPLVHLASCICFHVTLLPLTSLFLDYPVWGRRLFIGCRPQVAWSVAGVSGCGVARSRGAARSPKEAAGDLAVPCGGFSCFLACILPDGGAEHAGSGVGRLGQVGWGRGRADTQAVLCLEAQGEHWSVLC